jgi:hypothetical protein
MVGVSEGRVVLVGEREAVESLGVEVSAEVEVTAIDVGRVFTGEHPDRIRINTIR